jgi:hypothetical protein
LLSHHEAFVNAQQRARRIAFAGSRAQREELLQGGERIGPSLDALLSQRELVSESRSPGVSSTSCLNVLSASSTWPLCISTCPSLRR